MTTAQGSRIAQGTRLDTRAPDSDFCRAGEACGFMDVEAQKRAAAARAVEFVRPGMRLGLGTGSTANHFVELLAARVRSGLEIVAVPTSEATRALAQRLGAA